MQQRFPFISNGAFAARAPFRFAGVAFYPRDPFPGGRVQNVDTRRLRQLWNSRLIECVGPAIAPAPAPASVETATETETGTETSVVLELGEGVSASTEVIEHDDGTRMLDVVVHSAPVASPDPTPEGLALFVAHHLGFGRFGVRNTITGETKTPDVVMKKAEAEAWAAELNSEPRRGAGEVAETTGDGLPPDGSATSADLTGE